MAQNYLHKFEHVTNKAIPNKNFRVIFCWPHLKGLEHCINIKPNNLTCISQGHTYVRDRAPDPFFYRMLGQTHVSGWSRVVTSQNGGSTDYIFPLRLGVLQWSRHLFNYWKNKKTIIEKFLILLI